MSKAKSFVVDQKVVYPSQGVGVIKSIVQKKFNGAKIPLYVKGCIGLYQGDSIYFFSTVDKEKSR